MLVVDWEENVCSIGVLGFCEVRIISDDVSRDRNRSKVNGAPRRRLNVLCQCFLHGI